MNCLVTGGAGFIGSHLVDRLIKEDHQVIVIDNLSTGKRENLNPQATFWQADIRDLKKIRPFFQGIDYVFHLAALPRVPISIEDPVTTSAINILGTINVFKGAIDEGVKRIIFASSSAVYGDQKELPFKEGLSPLPASPYGLQKLVGEQVAALFTKLYQKSIISLRYFNIFGPRTDFNSDYSLVMGKFLRLKSQQKPLTIFGTGEQTRDYCYIEDVVEATIRAAESSRLKGGEVINIGSGKAYSVNTLAGLIGGEVVHLPPRPGDVLHTRADITLAKELLGWQPKVSFQEGVERTREWFRRQQG